MLGNDEAVTDSAAELERQFPEFDAEGFIASLPYTEESYRQAVAEPLRKAIFLASAD